MTDKQLENLKTIAAAISSGHPVVSESFAIGKIAQVTGRTYDKAIEGLKMMHDGKLLPPDWIKPETEGILSRMTAANPALEKLFSVFDVIPGKTEICEFEGFCKPRPIDPEGLKKVFSLPEF